MTKTVFGYKEYFFIDKKNYVKLYYEQIYKYININI